jgi:hypothetical protein
MGAEIQLGAGVGRKVVMTPIQAKTPYPWDEFLNLIHTHFAYMEARIDPLSSIRQLISASISEHSTTGEIWVPENRHAFEKMGFHKTDETAHYGYNQPTSIMIQKDLV